MQLVQPQPFDEAVAKLGARSVVGSTLNSAEWRDVPVALRETAFFSSEVQNVRFLERAKAELTDYLAGARDPATGALKTGSRAEFVSRLQRFAQGEGMGPLRPQDKGGVRDITSEKRLGLIFDTQAKMARDYGNWKQGMDPAVLDEFPAQRFIRVHQVKRPRPFHQAALGEVRLKTDTAFWVSLNRDFGVPWGPWGFNSGCDVEDVDRDEAESLGLVKAGQRLQPVDKAFTDGLAASLQNVEPALRDKLKAAFGNQVVIDGDTVRWKGKDEAPPPVEDEATGPTTLDEALDLAGVVEGQPADAAQMTALQSILQKPDALSLADKLSSFQDVRGSLKQPGLLAEPNVRAHAQEFLNLLPRRVAEALPSFRIAVDKSNQRGGSYDRGTRTVALESGLRTADPQWVRQVIWHEMMHWVYFHGPADYRTAIADHFAARTAGEPLAKLPGYGSATGRRDQWFDAYAGRRYSPADDGLGWELPTKYIELLSLPPAQLAVLWNRPLVRETLKIVMQILFK